MTLKDLKERIDFCYEMNEQNHDLIVCIPNNKGGFGGTSVTIAKHANRGFDWDRGKFIITPEVPMIEKPKTP